MSFPKAYGFLWRYAVVSPAVRLVAVSLPVAELRLFWGNCPAISARLSPRTVKKAASRLSSSAERP